MRQIVSVSHVLLTSGFSSEFMITDFCISSVFASALLDCLPEYLIGFCITNLCLSLKTVYPFLPVSQVLQLNSDLVLCNSTIWPAMDSSDLDPMHAAVQAQDNQIHQLEEQLCCERICQRTEGPPTEFPGLGRVWGENSFYLVAIMNIWSCHLVSLTPQLSA